MRKTSIPVQLLERIKAVKNKRARFVLDTLVANDTVTSTEIQNAGYDHPPRAVRDAVELGFAIKRVKAKRKDGQSIAGYQFDAAELDPNKTGRVVMSKKERDQIIGEKGAFCNACGGRQNLQVDHRIPYEVAGESQKDTEDPYQVLDGSCNRKKSWACEHCVNLLRDRNFGTCATCYWSDPTNYSHVATVPERRLEIVWDGEDTVAFERIAEQASQNKRSIQDEIKAIVAQKSEG